ncbi:hypothetical protein QF022_000425 [Vogesella perlucida]|nr:hypothetical protein [Vogesella perlucida]
MKTTARLAATLLLALSAAAVAEPLTFGWLESWSARRDKFEKHFVIGDALQRFEVGKKQLVLPAGKWVISEVETYAPEITEVGGSDSVGTTVDGSLWLQDTESGDEVYVQTLLSTPSNRVWLSGLSAACGGKEDQEQDKETVYLQQLDSVKSDRQSCVRLTGRQIKDKDSGQPVLMLFTHVMESRDGDYVRYTQSHVVALKPGQGTELADLDKATRAYLAAQLRWGVQTKADIARQMGW